MMRLGRITMSIPTQAGSACPRQPGLSWAARRKDNRTTKLPCPSMSAWLRHIQTNGNRFWRFCPQGASRRSNLIVHPTRCSITKRRKSQKSRTRIGNRTSRREFWLRRKRRESLWRRLSNLRLNSGQEKQLELFKSREFHLSIEARGRAKNKSINGSVLAVADGTDGYRHR